jgi:hypothetical protein
MHESARDSSGRGGEALSGGRALPIIEDMAERTVVIYGKDG